MHYQKFKFYIKSQHFIVDLIEKISEYDSIPYEKREKIIYTMEGKLLIKNNTIIRLQQHEDEIQDSDILNILNTKIIMEDFIFDASYETNGDTIFNIPENSIIINQNKKIYNINSNIKFIILNEIYDDKMEKCYYFEIINNENFYESIETMIKLMN